MFGVAEHLWTIPKVRRNPKIYCEYMKNVQVTDRCLLSVIFRICYIMILIATVVQKKKTSNIIHDATPQEREFQIMALSTQSGYTQT